MRIQSNALPWLSLGALYLAVLTGCSNYSFSLNDNELYRPSPLFTQYELKDRALSRCVAQTIKDAKVSEAGELKRLNCSSAGIVHLEGLETFGKLEGLNLANNELEDLSTLRQLSRLKTVILKDNDIVSAEPLLPLVRLERLDLRDNEQLECATAEQLAQLDSLEVQLPEHCDS